MSELDRIKKQAHKDAIAHRDGTDDFGYTDIEDAVDDLVTVLTAYDEQAREIERLQNLVEDYQRRLNRQPTSPTGYRKV